MTDSVLGDVQATEFPSRSIVDSRRLFGPNIYGLSPGAVLEVKIPESRVAEVCSRWKRHVAYMRRRLGWSENECVARMEAGGASLYMSAPVDTLMTATEVNERAWLLALIGLHAADTAEIERMRTDALAEQSAQLHLSALYESAAKRGVTATFDDDEMILGSGVGSFTAALSSLPSANAIDWSSIMSAPIAMVTGSNGKTTTTRLIAAMLRRSGRHVGLSCSDGVWFDDEKLESGDFAGPAGARLVIRDTRVTAAVLETARGGMLRRGLAVTRADVAVITNVAEDHFGEYGISSLRELTEVKAIVARVVEAGGVLVLNGDDDLLTTLADQHRGRISIFSADSEGTVVRDHIANGGNATVVAGDAIVLIAAGDRIALGDVKQMPLTLGGSAPHNVVNALAASLAAYELGVELDVIRDTLRTFGSRPSDNPGRLQVFEIGGATIVVDYAHNPDGLKALCHTALAFTANRRALLLGQAGNREDEDVRALVDAALGGIQFDYIVVKETPELLRGRAFGEISEILVDELHANGFAPGKIEVAETELAAVNRALEWARDGDLLIFPIHVQKQEVLALLTRLRDTSWIVETPLPN